MMRAKNISTYLFNLYTYVQILSISFSTSLVDQCCPKFHQHWVSDCLPVMATWLPRKWSATYSLGSRIWSCCLSARPLLCQPRCLAMIHHLTGNSELGSFDPDTYFVPIHRHFTMEAENYPIETFCPNEKYPVLCLNPNHGLPFCQIW